MIPFDCTIFQNKLHGYEDFVIWFFVIHSYFPQKLTASFFSAFWYRSFIFPFGKIFLFRKSWTGRSSPFGNNCRNGFVVRTVKWGWRSEQKQSSRVFCKKGVLRNFTAKYLCQSLFFNKVAGLMPATLLKKRLADRRFPVNFVKFLRTAFFTTEHLCSGGCFWTLIMTSIFIMSNIAAFRVTFRIRSQSYQTSKGGASSYRKFS